MSSTRNEQQRKRAIGYVRVSTDKQADRGASLEVQTEKLKAMACVQGMELVGVITDAGESAKNIDRPGMKRLLALVDRGEVDAVIIAKLDRLTRSVKDLAELLERFQRRNVALVSVNESLDTGSAAGRLVINIMTAVSQWEREAIGERTAAVLQHKKASGFVYNKVPFGYRKEGQNLLPLPEEQVVIGRIKLYRSNGWTLRGIAETLNREGIPAKVGGRWHAKTVSDVLNNTLNAA